MFTFLLSKKIIENLIICTGIIAAFNLCKSNNFNPVFESDNSTKYERKIHNIKEEVTPKESYSFFPDELPEDISDLDWKYINERDHDYFVLSFCASDEYMEEIKNSNNLNTYKYYKELPYEEADGWYYQTGVDEEGYETGERVHTDYIDLVTNNSVLEKFDNYENIDLYIAYTDDEEDYVNYLCGYAIDEETNTICYFSSEMKG